MQLGAYFVCSRGKTLTPPSTQKKPPNKNNQASIPVVGFNAVLMSEHFGAFFAVIVLHAALRVRWIRALLPPKQFEAATKLVLSAGLAAFGVLFTLMLGYVLQSPTFGWTGMLCRLFVF